MQNNIALDGPYAGIGVMRLWLPKLEDNNKKAKTLRVGGLLKDWEDVEGVFQYQGLLYVP